MDGDGEHSDDDSICRQEGPDEVCRVFQTVDIEYISRL